MKRIAVTGASGFLGKNLVLKAAERSFEVVQVPHHLGAVEIANRVANVDLVFHLAGVNRPTDEAEFETGNCGFTSRVVEGIGLTGRTIGVVYASSVQAEIDNPYGRSKLAAERIISGYSDATGAPNWTFRLPAVFGKWSRPNYNSVVATFCYNIGRGLPVTVHDPDAKLKLVYIDDVVERFLDVSERPLDADSDLQVGPLHELTVGQLLSQIQLFRDSRMSLQPGRVGVGLERALYSTYVSFLDPTDFAYPISVHRDQRGEFGEVLRTADSGQLSYFTALPGITRGGHYHHTKTEKFLVLFGMARFRFKHMDTGEVHTIEVDGTVPTIVETAPGWAHDITNIGKETLVALLWANELFDRSKPDTTMTELR